MAVSNFRVFHLKIKSKINLSILLPTTHNFPPHSDKKLAYFMYLRMNEITAFRANIEIQILTEKRWSNMQFSIPDVIIFRRRRRREVC